MERKTIQAFVTEGTDSKYTKLQASLRKKINADLSSSKMGSYHDRIPIKFIDNILDSYGLVLLQEDGTEFEGMFSGSHSQCTIELGYKASAERQKWGITYTPIENSVLFLSWYQMSSGRYEIVCYVS